MQLSASPLQCCYNAQASPHKQWKPKSPIRIVTKWATGCLHQIVTIRMSEKSPPSSQNGAGGGGKLAAKPRVSQNGGQRNPIPSPHPACYHPYVKSHFNKNRKRQQKTTNDNKHQGNKAESEKNPQRREKQQTQNQSNTEHREK